MWVVDIPETEYIYLGDVMMPIGHKCVGYDGDVEFWPTTSVRLCVLTEFKPVMYRRPVYAHFEDLEIVA